MGVGLAVPRRVADDRRLLARQMDADVVAQACRAAETIPTIGRISRRLANLDLRHRGRPDERRGDVHRDIPDVTNAALRTDRVVHDRSRAERRIGVDVLARLGLIVAHVLILPSMRRVPHDDTSIRSVSVDEAKAAEVVPRNTPGPTVVTQVVTCMSPCRSDFIITPLAERVDVKSLRIPQRARSACANS